MSTDLERAGRKLRSARKSVQDAIRDVEAAALTELAAGATESDVARRAGVDRMTVRKWRGKR